MKRKTLRERAGDAIAQCYYAPDVFDRRKMREIWLAGYRAAQRDRRRK